MRRSIPLLLLLVACGFPNVMFKPVEADDASDEEGGAIDSGEPEHVDPPLPDGGGDEKPPLGDSGKPCDKDNDTFLADTCMVDGSPGTDCDDTDNRANTSVSMFKYWTATPQTKGDWNCSHTIETEVKIVDLKCTNYPYGTNCGALGPGFETNPPCGYFANYVTCKSGGLLQTCVVATSEMKQQGCK